MSKITLEKGKALLIRGDQGSGKTTRARAIAKEHGSYTETTMDELCQGKFGLGRVLKGDPTTVIVEEFGGNREDVAVAKVLITSEKLTVERQGENPVEVTPPNFIFVSGHADPIPLDKADRRFSILTIHN